MLIRSGANLERGFLSLTKQFKDMHFQCYSKNRMIEDFYHFFNTMSMLPPPIASTKEVRSHFQINSGGYDQRTGVYMLTGH
eukprot:784816-Prorocentrum_lima.AAC.1